MGRKAIACVILLAFGVASAFSETREAPPTPEGERWALLFNLGDLLHVGGFEDSYQAGAGALYRLTPSWSLRALLGIDHVDGETVDRTALGASVGAIWQPKPGTVAPYAGGQLGGRTLSETGQDDSFDFYFGALAGVETRIYRNLALFVEYDLIASWDAEGFTLRLGDVSGTGAGHAGVMLGLAAYF